MSGLWVIPPQYDPTMPQYDPAITQYGPTIENPFRKLAKVVTIAEVWRNYKPDAT